MPTSAPWSVCAELGPMRISSTDLQQRRHAQRLGCQPLLRRGRFASYAYDALSRVVVRGVKRDGGLVRGLGAWKPGAGLRIAGTIAGSA